MAKKVVVSIIIMFVILCNFQLTFATETEEKIAVESETAEELYEIKEGVSSSIEDYVARYGSYPYGIAAYILNTVRIYSIPFCFLGIIVGSIYQYMLGIRTLDVRDKGFALIISFVTILLICQVLPLIFTIVVTGWRG